MGRYLDIVDRMAAVAPADRKAALEDGKSTPPQPSGSGLTGERRERSEISEERGAVAQPAEIVRAWLTTGVFDALPLLPLGPTGGLHHPRDIARVSLADAPLGGVAGERARAMLTRLVAIIQTDADPVSGSQVPDSRTPEREAPTRNDSLDKTDNSVRAPEDGIAAARRLFDDLAEKPATEPIRHCVSCGAELPPRLRYRCASCTRAAYARLGRPLPPSLAWLNDEAEDHEGSDA